MGYKVPHNAKYAPGDRAWGELGLATAVDLRALWRGLPMELRNDVADTERAGATAAQALESFVSRRRGALRRMRGREGCAALAPDWRACLIGHSLFEQEAAALTEALGREAAAGGGVLELDSVRRLSSQPLNLYRLVSWGLEGPGVQTEAAVSGSLAAIPAGCIPAS